MSDCVKFLGKNRMKQGLQNTSHKNISQADIQTRRIIPDFMDMGSISDIRVPGITPVRAGKDKADKTDRGLKRQEWPPWQ